MLTPSQAEILHVAIPFQFTFRHALAARSAGDSIVLRLTGQDGQVGFGECAPREYVTDETADTVRVVLARMLPLWVGRAFGSLDEVKAALEQAAVGLARDEHAAFCALELALLDLAGRSLQVSAGAVLGPVVVPRIHYSGILSADGVDAAKQACAAMQRLAPTAVKVKVGGTLADDLAVLRTARDILGNGCSLRVDANCAWTALEALRRMEAYAGVGLEGCEQPVPAEDFDGMAWLTARSPVPIIADESLVSAEDAQRLAAERGCHLFNIRISKCGGLLNSARIAAIGRAAGIGCMLGAQVGETALLSAAGRQFGTRVPDVRFFEGSYGKLLLTEDIATAEITFGKGGEAPALLGPGLGVDVDPQRLDAHVTRRAPVAR